MRHTAIIRNMDNDDFNMIRRIITDIIKNGTIEDMTDPALIIDPYGCVSVCSASYVSDGEIYMSGINSYPWEESGENWTDDDIINLITENFNAC